MPSMDVFSSDAFSLRTLTDAINKAHYKPGRIGELGLFQERGITTSTVQIEEKDGRLSLIQTSPRGGHAPPSSIGQQKRTMRAFVVPHLERDSVLYAEEVQNVRAFGSEDDAQSVQQLVDERLMDLRAMHEVTLERLRAKAIQGIVTDADGSTLFNLFTEFGVSQQTAEIDVGSGDPVREEIIAAVRLSEYALGGEMISGFRAFCGDTFFDGLTQASEVKDSLKYQESVLLRSDLRKGFEYGGVTWENYRGRVAATTQVSPDVEGAQTPFFADDEAYLVPEGTGIFRTYNAPADFLETVNTVGLPIYAKTSVDPEFQRWVKIHSQSNPLTLCLRPRAIVKLSLGT